MSSVYDPTYTSETKSFGETSTQESLKDRGSRAFQSASRAASDTFRKVSDSARRVSDSAGELFDTPEKRNVTIGALTTTLGIGFLLGFLIGRSTAD